MKEVHFQNIEFMSAEADGGGIRMIDIYSLFYVVVLFIFIICIFIVMKVSKNSKKNPKTYVGSLLFVIITTVSITSLFYGSLKIIYHTPFSIKENLGIHTFTAKYQRFFSYDGLYLVRYTSNEDAYYSFVEKFNTEEKAIKAAEKDPIVMRQVLIDSTGAIEIIPVDVTEKDYLNEKQKWIVQYVIAEVLGIAVIVGLIILLRKNK